MTRSLLEVDVVLLKISVGPLKLRDTSGNVWKNAEQPVSAVSGGGSSSAGNVSVQPLAWEARMGLLTTSGHNHLAPWMRLFVLFSMLQICPGSYPYGAAPPHALTNTSRVLKS